MSLRTHRVTLTALALMLFCFLTSEVFVAGAMLPMSRDLGATPAAVGSLVSSYAVVAAVAIVPMTALSARTSTQGVLVAGLVLLAAAQVVVAVAPSLGWVVAARAATALFHGPVWALAPVLVATLVPERPAAATAAVFLGGSAANLAGAPLVAVLSNLTSWRWAAALLGAVSIGCAAVLAQRLPDVAKRADGVGRPSTRALGQVRVVTGWCVAVALLAAAHLCAFTYVSDDARHAGLADHDLGLLLLAMGVAGAAGTFVMGRMHDSHPRASLLSSVAAMAIGLALTATVGGLFVAGAVLWAAFYAALVAALPAQVVQAAPGWAEAASAWYVLTFQLGIAGGATLGGWAASAADPHVTRALTAVALTLLAGAPLWALGRQAARRPGHPHLDFT